MSDGLMDSELGREWGARSPTPDVPRPPLDLSSRECRVLTALQRGIALQARPFEGLDLPEAEVVALLRRAAGAGMIRRFGGIFDAGRLGYTSVLCALDVDDDRLAACVPVIVRHPGVTHCYARQSLDSARRCPRLWFTLAMPGGVFEAGVQAMRDQLGGVELLLLPAWRRFKIDVVFDLNGRRADARPQGATPAVPADDSRLSTMEQKLVRMLDQDLPVTARPFDGLARLLRIPVDDLLAILGRWQREGVMRRIAPILHHRRAGIAVNVMCVWPVAGDIEAAGQRVAAWPAVTHCYQRPRVEAFPYDLYAMIHTADRQSAVALYEQIAAECGLETGMMCVSTREFKKTSLRYFDPVHGP